MNDYSVLMSVYYKEKPEYLRQSIQSILNQTVPPSEFVIVCDGQLTHELDAILEEFCHNYSIISIVRLEHNIGIGPAANIGLSKCTHEIIAKMDSDDISLPCRCELELKLLENNPELALVGTYIDEFEENQENVVSTRKVPCMHMDILKYARRRSPFNNQTIMYRKSVVLACGGYSNLRRAEDYDLFVRILAAGYKTRNIPLSLVKYRLSKDVYKRRRTLDNFKGFIKVHWRIYRIGFCSMFDFLLPCIAQLILMILPNETCEWFYLRLRKN